MHGSIDWRRDLKPGAVVVATALVASALWGVATGTAVALTMGIALSSFAHGRSQR